jgi:DNA-binding NarL/FixJ family response regulator
MNIRVGIVEDEREIREYFVALINGCPGFECVCAFGNAEDAMEKLPDFRPDVVLMDIHLPGKSGIECIASLKPKCPDTHFLICTSYEDTDSVFKALSVGATGYLTKTVQSSKLLDSITEVFNGGSPMSSHIARKVVSSFEKSQEQKEAELLSEREKEVLHMLSKGFRYKEIADKLFLSTETVRTHIRNIYRKLQVNSRTDAINKAFYK